MEELKALQVQMEPKVQEVFKVIKGFKEPQEAQEAQALKVQPGRKVREVFKVIKVFKEPAALKGHPDVARRLEATARDFNRALLANRRPLGRLQ